MSSRADGPVTRVVTAWVGVVERRPWPVALGLVLLTVLAAWWGTVSFRMDSDLGRMIHQQADWRDDFERFKAEFPDLVNTALVVVSGPSRQGVRDGTAALADALGADARFSAVYAPAADPFLYRHGLLFLDAADREAALVRLAEAQPALTALAEDPSLVGLLDLLAGGLGHAADADLPSGFTRLADRLATSAEALAAGGDGALRWGDEFYADDPGAVHYGIVFLKGHSDSGDAVPNAGVMQALRGVIGATPLPADVAVRVTGEVALAYEEIAAAQRGVQIAGTVSTVLLVAVLALGIRSLRIVAAIVLMLVIGILWTGAFAMAAIGTWNTLSVVFLVMFFGLGVDFAIHFALRCREQLAAPPADGSALRAATRQTAAPLALCTLTTAIGFLTFVPTDYRALGELGIISAGGMLIALAMTFTVLPLVFTLAGPPRPLPVPAPAGRRSPAARLRRFAPAILAATVLLALVAGWQASRMRFDFSVLALKDPRSESVVTLRELQREDVVTDYSISVLVAPEDVEAATARLLALDVVADVRRPADYVPDDQDQAAAELADTATILWSALEPLDVRGPSTAAERQAAVARLQQAHAAADPATLDPAAAAAATRLVAAIGNLVEGDPDAVADRIAAWERAATADMPRQLDWLRAALAVGPFGLDDVPVTLRERLIASDGRHLLVVLPREDIADVAALDRFIVAVRAAVPGATGRPVIEWGVGGIVVGAFTQALLLAVALIAVVLVVALRSVRDAVLVLAPLVLAALCTLASAVWLGTSLNMANILVLPLIFGIGVDNGIHVVERFRREGNLDGMLASSTPRAVLLSTLTTVGTFFALVLSPHQGTASIGVLLTIAIAWLLVFTVVVLPLLLERFGGPAAAPAAP